MVSVDGSREDSVSLFSKLLFDTNALQYLKQLGLLEACVGAVAEPCTLDLIRFEEMENPKCPTKWEDVEPFGMRALELTEEMTAKAAALNGDFHGLSYCDAALIVRAKEEGIPIFTEDRAMVNVMKDQEVQHVSLPAMVDWLVDAGKISSEKAEDVFRRMSTNILSGWEKNYPEIYPVIREKYSLSRKKDDEGD